MEGIVFAVTRLVFYKDLAFMTVPPVLQRHDIQRKLFTEDHLPYKNPFLVSLLKSTMTYQCVWAGLLYDRHTFAEEVIRTKYLYVTNLSIKVCWSDRQNLYVNALKSGGIIKMTLRGLKV